MSWSICTSGTKVEVKRLVASNAFAHGYMPLAHLSAVYQAIDDIVGERLSLNAYGHVSESNGAGSFNIQTTPA